MEPVRWEGSARGTSSWRKLTLQIDLALKPQLTNKRGTSWVREDVTEDVSGVSSVGGFSERNQFGKEDSTEDVK